MKIAKCDVSVGAKFKMTNIVHAWKSDVDLIICDENMWVPYHDALKVGNGMQKCTIINAEQITSFLLFYVGLLCLNGITACVLINNGITGTVEPSVCLDIDVDDVKRSKSYPNATNRSIVTSSIFFSSFGARKFFWFKFGFN